MRRPERNNVNLFTTHSGKWIPLLATTIQGQREARSAYSLRFGGDLRQRKARAGDTAAPSIQGFDRKIIESGAACDAQGSSTIPQQKGGAAKRAANGHQTAELAAQLGRLHRPDGAIEQQIRQHFLAQGKLLAMERGGPELMPADMQQSSAQRDNPSSSNDVQRQARDDARCTE